MEHDQQVPFIEIKEEITLEYNCIECHRKFDSEFLFQQHQETHEK